MRDFIFGAFASDELKIIHARARARGLRHSARIAPQDPLPGEPVTLTVTVGPDLSVDHLACYYTVDGREPVGSRGMAQEGRAVPLEKVAVEWHLFLWGYLERWEVTLPSQPEGTTVRYRIGGWQGADGREIWADWPPVQEHIEWATVAFFTDESISDVVSPTASSDERGRTFAYSVDRLKPPQWAREAVVYQVFVDRFNPGDGRSFEKPDSLRDFFGGTLRGVTEKLDYIADLDATCIWLSPVFASPTHHGYDVTDYHTIDPRWGSNDDLRQLVQMAHDRDIRVILDFVCNHVSVQHPFFREALANPASPYRDWFTFDVAYPHGYRTYFNVARMPRLNTDHPAVRDYLIDVAQYRLTAYDVDGFRLDHASGPSYAFWSEFWTACKEVKPDCWCFGEVAEPPMAVYPYQGRLDGCLDFHLCDLLRRTFAWGTLELEDLARGIDRHEQFFLPAFDRPSFLDNHDMNRFLYLTGGEDRQLRLAALVLMTLPGQPIIYYGTEVGLSQNQSKEAGEGSDEARLPMLWGDEQDRDLLSWYRQLIAARRAHPVIWEGERVTLFADSNSWCYQIAGADAQILVAVNVGADPRHLRIERAGVTHRLNPLIRVGSAALEWQDRAFLLNLPSQSGGVWAG
ncbi:MAG: alpha-amylase family glycosyl hydrolase [Chloroflexota bacterium]|nr:alpha-amylase family glycosyl hydrolase [Chloroflexota bacterium]